MTNLYDKCAHIYILLNGSARSEGLRRCFVWTCQPGHSTGGVARFGPNVSDRFSASEELLDSAIVSQVYFL